MDWQYASIALVLCAAAVYLSRRFVRTWFGKEGCSSGCGNCQVKVEEPVSSKRISLL